MTSLPIFGHSPEEGLVGLELMPPDPQARQQQVSIYLRQGDRVKRRLQTYRPFILLEDEALLKGCPIPVKFSRLQGSAPLKTLAQCATWPELQQLRSWLMKTSHRTPSDPNAPFLIINDPIQQFLLTTGQTLFKGMAFEQLRRMQLDIETYTAPGFDFPNAARASDCIIIIALGEAGGWVETLTDSADNEKRLLERFVELVRQRDPDVIEGHNIFKFDLPYLAARAARWRVPLALGRDGSQLRRRPSRIVLGERTLTFPRFEIAGRHIIDTFFLLQIYDQSQRALEGFGLKEAAVHFGIASPKRVYIAGADISQTFLRDPERVRRYAADDIGETRALAEILSRGYFTQAQMLPFTYQNVCLRGNAAKIDALMIREYLRRGHSLPFSKPARSFAGGYSDIFIEGVVHNVQHCDARSLYPSIMLAQGLAPSSDELGVFLSLLDYLRDYRLKARQHMRAAKTPPDVAHWDALQSTFKILINSFYGYLGYPQARFNDFVAAQKVAAAGRAILQQMVDWLKQHGARPIEIDTDGIYFVPPSFPNRRAEQKFQRAFQESLPPNIEVEFDGKYLAMFSYKIKNYALLEASGAIIIKGVALKSRGLEPYLRAFLREYLRLKLEARAPAIPALKAHYERELRGGTMPIRQLAKTESLKDSPRVYAAKIDDKARGRNAAYELALRSGRPYQAGDQVSYYITGTKKTVAVHKAAKLVADWNPAFRDENIPYYLAKLQALYTRFESDASLDKKTTAKKS